MSGYRNVLLIVLSLGTCLVLAHFQTQAGGTLETMGNTFLSIAVLTGSSVAARALNKKWENGKP